MLVLTRNDLIALELSRMVHASQFELAVAIVDLRMYIAQLEAVRVPQL